MSTNMKSRELPAFEVHGTDEFHVFRNFFLTTAVLPLRIERKDQNNGDAIIFYVFNDEDCGRISNSDRLKALGSLKNLYRVFDCYKYVIIKEIKDYVSS